VAAYDIYRQVDIYCGEAVGSFFHAASMRGLRMLRAAGLKLGTVHRTTRLATPFGLRDLSPSGAVLFVLGAPREDGTGLAKVKR
jgi:hypothetical protein